jgi:16S rRNA G527 N7-methylase RsmG
MRRPNEIARDVRSIIEEYLAQISYDAPGPDFLERIEVFAATLALWGSKLNLTSTPDDPAKLAFHVIDSLAPLILPRSPEGASALAYGGTTAVDGTTALSDAFATGASVLDLGSGAGFPALILAAACAADFTLLEARRKRASFLAVAASEMGLANVHVNSAAGASTRLQPVFDLVTARAFAKPAIVYGTAAATLKPGGRAIIYASPSQKSEIEFYSRGRFESAVFLPYDVSVGPAPIAHLLAVSKSR